MIRASWKQNLWNRLTSHQGKMQRFKLPIERRYSLPLIRFQFSLSPHTPLKASISLHTYSYAASASLSSPLLYSIYILTPARIFEILNRKCNRGGEAWSGPSTHSRHADSLLAAPHDAVTQIPQEAAQLKHLPSFPLSFHVLFAEEGVTTDHKWQRSKIDNKSNR